jgi:hypothetical protein
MKADGKESHLLSHCILAWLTLHNLQVVATCCSETSVDFQRPTLRYFLEYKPLHNHQFENLKSCMVCIIIIKPLLVC